MIVSPAAFPELVYPLRLGPGEAPAQPVVAPGERVARGQCIAVPGDADGVRIHAAAAATVSAIELRPAPRGATRVASIVLRPEEDTAAVSAEGRRARSLDATLAMIRDAGILGHGGGGFPLHRKVGAALASGRVRALVVNAMECEAPIDCDRAVLATRGPDVIAGAEALARLLGIDHFILALGARTSSAGLRAAAARRAGAIGVRCVELESGYTAGDERILLARLLGRARPGAARPSDEGHVVTNVGTALAVHDLLADGVPPGSRHVTLVAGDAATSVTVELPLGARIADALAHAGVPHDRSEAVLIGGYRMGRPVLGPGAPVAAITNCVIVGRTGQSVAMPNASEPCIGCGRCNDACPYRLPAQQLLRAVGGATLDPRERCALDTCTLCGCCDVVCPSRIPLSDRFAAAKQTRRLERHARARAEAARARFDAHADRAAARRRPVRVGSSAAEAAGGAVPAPAAAVPSPAQVRDEVARAVARVRSRRARAGEPEPR